VALRGVRGHEPFCSRLHRSKVAATVRFPPRIATACSSAERRCSKASTVPQSALIKKTQVPDCGNDTGLCDRAAHSHGSIEVFRFKSLAGKASHWKNVGGGLALLTAR
jgi:hypothetical protein